ncbi:MAG: hypothetical protein ACK5MT_20345 [Actinomycetales bacterium]
MRWFRRRGPRDDFVEPRQGSDPHLRHLQWHDASDLIALVVDACVAQGRDCRYDGAGGLVLGRHVYSLDGLARVAGTTARSAWPALVDRHVRALLLADAVSDPATLDEAADLLRAQLRPLSSLPELPEAAVTVLPGVAMICVLDHPSHITELVSMDLVSDYGGLDAVYEVALENLRALPAPTISDICANMDRPDATVHVLQSEDFYGAARALILPQMLAQIGVERPPYGVLFAVPTRHLLVLHVVRGEGAVPALKSLARLAQVQFGEGPGAISPHVFYAGPDDTDEVRMPQRVTSFDPRGELTVTVDGPLHAAFGALGLVQPGPGWSADADDH